MLYSKMDEKKSIVYPEVTERMNMKLHYHIYRSGTLPACECLSNRIKCTEECKLKDCTNSEDAIDDEAEQISDEDEDDDYDD